jgi:lipopolysaccharide exporter
VIIMPSCGLMMALARPLVLTVYGAKWAMSAEVLSILPLYTAISVICALLDSMLASLGKANSNLALQLLWLGLLIPAMALGVHLDGIAGAAMAHIAVVGAVILPAYMFLSRKAAGLHFAGLGKAIIPSLLPATAAALAAKGAAAQFASPLVQLIAGLAAGGVVYMFAAGRECLVFLSQEQTAKLGVWRLFRLYSMAVHAVRLPLAGGPRQRRQGGKHRSGMDAEGDSSSAKLARK